jgi:hypothetical protein
MSHDGLETPLIHTPIFHCLPGEVESFIQSSLLISVAVSSCMYQCMISQAATSFPRVPSYVERAYGYGISWFDNEERN